MATNTPQLDEQSRSKLDGIVQKMQANKEPDTNIQAVVNDFKQKYSSGSSKSLGGFANAPQSPNLEIPTSDNQPPKSFGQKALGVGKAVGNFLFPIVGDVYHDIKGDSQKTFLQQGGDLALSALPFIPGLGEVGEAGRGAELAVEGGELAAKSGLLGKLAGSTIAKGAATGYGAGVASNLSQGKGIGESLKPGVNTIGGAIFGGAAPVVMKGATGLLRNAIGMNPQIETELTRLGSQANPEDVPLFQKYMSAARAHATDINVKPPLTMAADEVDKAAGIIQKKVEAAGAEVGAAKTAGSTVPLKPLNDVGNGFWKNVQDKYGLNIFTGKNGKIVIKPIEGSMVQTSSADMARIKNIAQQLSDLHTSGNATVKQASEVMGNLNNLVDHSKADIYGHTNDPLEGLIKNTAGNLNEVIRGSSPEIAAANDKFSALKDLQTEISGMAGKNLQKGELLMKRLFSGDKSGDVQDFFAKLKDATGVDLVKHGIFARNAVDTVGSKADKTLLQQAIEGAAEGKGGLLSSGLGLAKQAAQATIANPEKQGLRLLKGKAGLLKKAAPYATKAAIEVGSRLGQ